MHSRLHDALLFYHTVKHISLAQAWNRGWRRLRNLVPRRAPMPSGWRTREGFSWEPDPVALQDDSSLHRAAEISQGTFCFLSQTVNYGSSVRWNDPGRSRLWRYHLHYFDYVRDLVAWAEGGQRDAAWNAFRALAASWLQGNAEIAGDGWHPFTVSRRIVNWLEAVAVFRREASEDQAFRTRLLSSLYGQSRYLASNLEFDVRGNHLLENLRALIIAGVAFEGGEPDRWFEKGARLLELELREQVLGDGGHFERNPGYHVVVTQDLLDVRRWLECNRRPVPVWLQAALGRMLHFLEAILVPDGEVPLLKDTALGTWPLPAHVFRAAGHQGAGPARESVRLKSSGYFVLRDVGLEDYLVFDAGKPCPDYLPGHAHADLLSYELVVAGRRVVVDSGAYEYQAGPWRDWFRSTRAHNTVEVAGESQSEVWSSFRVARRARVTESLWLPQPDHIIVQASHDGYQRLPVQVLHRRTLLWIKGVVWLVFDELLGEGSTEAASYVHLHPSLDPVTDGKLAWTVAGPAGMPRLRFQGIGTVDSVVEAGWYSEQFGARESNKILTFHKRGPLPLGFGYCISRGSPVAVRLETDSSSSLLTLDCAGTQRCLVIPFEGDPGLR